MKKNKIIACALACLVIGMLFAPASSFAQDDGVPTYYGEGTGVGYYVENPEPQKLNGKQSDWATQELSQALALGFVQDEFLESWQEPVCREEFAVLIARAGIILSYERPAFQGSILIGDGNTDFYDSLEESRGIKVTFGNFEDCENEFVDFVFSAGFMSGVGEGAFAPQEPLTREQAATVIGRIAEKNHINSAIAATAYSDASGFSPWAKKYISYVSTIITPSGKHVMGGVGYNTFAPQDEFTREQAIVAVYRLWTVIESAE